MPAAPKTASAARIESARKFALAAAQLAAGTRCHNVAVLEVLETSPVCDFLILCSGTSARQMRSVADQIIELGERQDHAALNQDGYESENWILVDFMDVVLHVFSDEARAYYDLDNLWGDAKRIEVGPK